MNHYHQEQFNIRYRHFSPRIFDVQFVSAEPLIGRMDIKFHYWPRSMRDQGVSGDIIDWVICGGESGPGARPMHPYWPMSIRDQCVSAGIPFFFKQWGEYISAYDAGYRSEETDQWNQTFGRAWVRSKRIWRFKDGAQMVHVGKKKSGRLLDGKIWEEYPLLKHSQ